MCIRDRLSQDTLVVIISQSGETADSLAALRLTKEMGVKTLAIVNVVGSSIAREADHVMYTLAGPEIAVATTKAYSTQLICMYILSMYAAQVRGEIEESTLNSMLKEIVLLPEKVASILADKERIQWFANKFASAHDVDVYKRQCRSRGNQRYNSAPDNMSTFIDWWFKPDVTEAGGRNFCTSSVKEKCLKWFDIGISQVISVF